MHKMIKINPIFTATHSPACVFGKSGGELTYRMNFNMNIVKWAALILCVIQGFAAFGQLTVNPSYTACPNQVVTVTATWPNVTINSMTLTSPNGGMPASGSLGPVTTFTISHSSTTALTTTFALFASGSAISGPVTGSVLVSLTIVPPPSVTFANPQYDYCAGSCATMVATPGAYSYQVSGGAGFNQIYTSNIITICNLSSVHNGTYMVTSIGTCTSRGIYTLNIAPNTPVSINSPSNVCQGACVNLTANIPNGNNYYWTHPLGFVINGSSAASVNINALCAAQPTDNGTYSVTVEEPYMVSTGTTCPRMAVTTVSVVQTSAVSATASPAGIVCENDKINFNAGATNAFGWSWTGPNNFISSIANPVINPAKPSNSGQYIVTALFTNNVITCTTSNTVNVTVIAVNQPAISMPNSVCQGSATGLSSLCFSATANSAIGWMWTGPNNFSTTAQGTCIPNPQPNAAGIYYVTAKFGVPSHTCAASNSVQLNVVPVNSVSVIPPAPVCMPGNGYLQASAIGAYQYSWAGPNNFSSPASNPIVYYPNVNASGIYTVTAYFSGGNITCSSTNTVNLTVNPILTFSLIPRQQACYNSSMTVLGPSGATSYTWISSNGFQANTKDIYFSSIQPQNSGTYTLNVSLGPCVTSGSTTIDILTPVAFTLQPLSRTMCSGDTTFAEVGLTGGSQNYAYIWEPAIYFTDDQRGPKKTIIPFSSIYYNVTVYDIACPQLTVNTSFSVNVNQPPKPKLDLEKTRGCQPLIQLYDPQTKNEAFVTTFDFGGLKKFQSDTTGKMIISLTDAGTYSLTVYSKGKKELGGCTGVYQFPYPIVVDPKPGSDILWDPTVPTTNDQITFTPTYLNGPITKRFWAFSGGEPAEIDTSIKIGPGTDTSNVENPVRKYKNIGIYPIMLIQKTEIGCIDTVARFMKVTDDFMVYIPNTFTPNNDGLNDVFMVKGSGMKTEGFSMEVKDRWGNTVYSSADITAGWDGRVNGVNAELGNYIYRIRVVGMNGEGRKEFVGHVTLMK
jgi:gliding motility-associated-like protein